MKPKFKKQTLDGNIETMLLAILSEKPNYGYAIIKQLKEQSQNLLTLGEGTIYPVLHRIEEKGLIHAKWETAQTGKPRKYYYITNKGNKSLAANIQQWQMLSKVMGQIFENVKIPDIDLKGSTL